MKKYSVLMSVYHKENPEYLQKSIESMLNQTAFPDEFIIVKDGPLTDRLDEVIESFVLAYDNLFTIIPLEKNGGLGQALNYGIKKSRNELIARMDSDDISLPERCEKQLYEFELNDKLVICGAQINEFIDIEENVVCSRQVPLSFDAIKVFARRRSPFNHPTVMYKRSALLEIGGYSEYGRKEDLDLFLRMVFSGNYAINLSEPLLLYRTNNDNLKRRKTWQNCSEYIQIMFSFFKNGNIRLSDMIYVSIGQISMFLLPEIIIKKLSDKFLRNKRM